jgi:uncharacterized protein YndB with AHSA1/START domain
MSMTAAIAPVRKEIRVAASPADAFTVFTAGLTKWWPPNHGIGHRPIKSVKMETKLGGRWLEFAEDGAETTVATIKEWSPPHRLVLVWQVNSQWKPDANMKSEVEVTFEPAGQDATLVKLLHHKFETMGEESGASMRRDVDGGWPRLLDRYAQLASGRPLPEWKSST